MKKKIGKKIIIILVVIFLLLLIYEIYIQYDGILDKSNPMSREEVIELVEKSKNCNNYLVLFKTGYSVLNSKHHLTQQTYVKDNKIRTVINGEEFTWINYNEDERIQFWGFPNVTISKQSDFSNGNIEKPRHNFGSNFRSRKL